MHTDLELIIEKYFLNQLQDLADNLIKEKSTHIISKNLKVAPIIQYITSNYNFRKRLFRNLLDQFIFINIENDVLLNDSAILTLLSIHTYKRAEDFYQIYQYLEDRNKTIVLYSDSKNIQFQQNLYSYKFFLAERLNFVFVSELETSCPGFEKIEVLPLTLESIIRDEILKYDVPLDLVQVFNKSQGDITKIHEAVMSVIINTNRELQREIEAFKSKTFEAKPQISVTISNGEIGDTISKEEILPIPKPIIETIESIQSEVSDQEIPKPIIISLEPKIIKKKKVKIISKDALNLSEREKAIYKILLDKKFISRNKIVSIAWGKDHIGEIKDDAIDQLISRMRRKFVKAGYEKKYITSKKGEGVVLINN
jgi:hypothetical protein